MPPVCPVSMWTTGLRSDSTNTRPAQRHVHVRRCYTHSDTVRRDFGAVPEDGESCLGGVCEKTMPAAAQRPHASLSHCQEYRLQHEGGRRPLNVSNCDKFSHTSQRQFPSSSVCVCVVSTCSIWHRSEEQSMFSQGWYIPRVTQFNRMTMMLTRSNQVEAAVLRTTPQREAQQNGRHTAKSPQSDTNLRVTASWRGRWLWWRTERL